MSTATYLVGDVFDRLAELADGSVDLVLTSPPFLALRSYLPADHPDKAKEIGSEATPAEFLDTMLALTAEWGRLLAPHGSLAVELGDTYSGSGGAGGDYDDGGTRKGQPKFRAGTPRWDGRPEGQVRTTTSDPVSYPARSRHGWPLPKSLTGIPTLYAWSLAYGRNLLTGQPSPAGMWRIRNLVAWVRPNPPVGALGDKFRPATSYVTVACKATDRWFDLDAVRTAPGPDHPPANGNNTKGSDERSHRFAQRINNAPGGAPPLDWWEITPGGYSGSHYAVFPPELPKRLIESMCPRRVCRGCGQPSRRIVGEATYVNNAGQPALMDMDRAKHRKPDELVRHFETSGDNSAHRIASTVGWSDCGHDDWRPGIVLDPFAGSGTTLMVATGLGRDALGIDLDDRNADLAVERCGMFLDVDHGTSEVTA